MSDFIDKICYVKYIYVGLMDEIIKYIISFFNYFGNVGREIGYMFLFYICFYDFFFLKV